MSATGLGCVKRAGAFALLFDGNLSARAWAAHALMATINGSMPPIGEIEPKRPHAFNRAVRPSFPIVDIWKKSG
jgi:hypothetical protein